MGDYTYLGIVWQLASLNIKQKTKTNIVVFRVSILDNELKNLRSILMTIMKISPSKDANRRLYFNVQEMDNAKSFPVWINEVADGKALLGHRGRMFVCGNESSGKWLEVSAPLRRTDINGNYEYEPKKNASGDFVGSNGNVVTNEDDAERQYVFVTDNNSNIKYGLIASIKVVNTKLDKTTGNRIPTKSTYLNSKVYSDSEAYEIAKSVFNLQISSNEDEKAENKTMINEQKKSMGSYFSMFVDSGSEHLSKLGFEFRDSGSDSHYSM